MNIQYSDAAPRFRPRRRPNPDTPMLATFPAMPSARFQPEAAWLDDLNSDQREAATHGLAQRPDDRPLLVIAGAGSGKTSTLAHRAACLVLGGTDPQRLLLLTFSRRAAQEMERRTGQVLARALGLPSGDAPALPWAGTFHGIGARLLRDCASSIGLNESLTIHDRGDAEDLMGLVRHELGFSAARSRFPLKGTCLAIYSRTVNGQAALREVLDRAYPWCGAWHDELHRLFEGYVRAKQAQNVLDYDDLLLYWAEMMQDPDLARDIAARFDHVLVDEYQDTNRLQASILLAMKPGGRGLTVVGDDAQAIYSFRAATVRNILDFPRQFEPQARVVALERNYRSTRPILEASNAVIAMAAERHAKTLWTDRESSDAPKLVTVSDEAGQARWVADQVLEQREAGTRLVSQAVLFRSSSHSAQLELELVRRNIPFVKYGGLRFLEAAHVKDVLALLRWAQNPRCRLAGFRVAQLLPGVGPATAARLLEAMERAAEPRAALADFVPGPGAAADWPALAGTYRALGEGAAGWPGMLEQAIQWYLPQLERLYDDARVRRGDLDQLLRIAAGYGSCERFLTELALDPPDATSNEAGPPHLDEDYLVLSTIHSAKGREWRSVYVLNAVDGCIPCDLGTGSDEALEEERRLLYVAMTRAREQLQIVVPQRFYVHQQTGMGDRHVYASRTRFIPDRIVHLFQRLPRPESLPIPQAAAPRRAPRMDLAARVRARWQAPG